MSERAENLAALEWQHGEVTVSGEIATIKLPEGWAYLEEMDAQWFVEKEWGNPPDPSILGLVFPPGDGGWAVIVSFDGEGYVNDEDAGDMDYDGIMEDMQAGEDEANEMRREAGYGSIALLGWAEKPHYDSTQKKIYWAKRLQFEGTPGVILNYDVRILGRRGNLILQAVASDEQLAEVAAGCKELLAVTAFTEGNRYEDFDSSIDKVALYGIGGLIAGKALLKVGILAKFGKFIAIGALFLIGGIKKLFGRGKETTEA